MLQTDTYADPSPSRSPSREKGKDMKDRDLEETQVMGADADEGQTDDVFGQQGEGKVNYRGLGWISTAVLLIKAQVGLGVLSLPYALQTLGLGPGLIVFFILDILGVWTGYYIGVFKLKHPEVYSLADCGRLMFGRTGEIIFGVGWFLFSAMTAGACFLTISTAFNAISLHATCTAVFVIVGVAVSFPFICLRTMGEIKWIGWVGLIFIVLGIFTAVIAVGVPGTRPALAPQDGPLDLHIVMWGNPSFPDALNAVANIFFAFSGMGAFLPVAAEMRNWRDYPKTLALSQTVVTVIYLIVAVVMYMYAGQYVASPALGTAGVLIKRVAYGLALPGLFFSAIIYTHFAAKLIFVRLLRNSRHMSEPTKTHWIVWLSCCISCTLFAYIVCSAIPIFSGLLGLISALFGSILALHAEALMYLYDTMPHWRLPKNRSALRTAGIVANVGILGLATFILVAGVYGSVVTIKDSYDSAGGVWSCADNSGSS
ncbi:hypothetical protein JCM10207_008911 [Rhodosporidiobolus poonsookiae]